MTWKTVQGERTLQGGEATLFAACLRAMIAIDKDGEEWRDADLDADDTSAGLNYNLPLIHGPFEDLTPAQKYTVMEEVATALLHDTMVAPELTAVNESAIYYVFMWLLRRFQEKNEDDFDEAVEEWGHLILGALKKDLAEDREEIERDPEDDRQESNYPDLECMELTKWDYAIHILWNKILWDKDWELYQNPPFDTRTGVRSGAYGVMQIDKGYFARYQGGVKDGARERLDVLVSAIPGVMGVEVIEGPSLRDIEFERDAPPRQRPRLS